MDVFWTDSDLAFNHVTLINIYSNGSSAHTLKAGINKPLPSLFPKPSALIRAMSDESKKLEAFFAGQWIPE